MPVYFGEEVPSGLWNAADPSAPVSVQQLVAYHNQYDATTGDPTAAMIGWYPKGDGNVRCHWSVLIDSMIPNP